MENLKTAKRNTILLKSRNVGVKLAECERLVALPQEQGSYSSNSDEASSSSSLEELNETTPEDCDAREEIARELSIADEENIIEAVLAFQRWRQHSLKRAFSQELRKLLDEARRDEASLSLMQHELQKKDENLSLALADAAHLRAHISAIEAAVSCNYNEDAQRQLQEAEERTVAAEEEIQRREKEIIRIKQRLKYFEDEKARVDSNLQANVSLLQQEKSGLAKENRALLDQLARKDQELHLQMENVEKLEAKIVSMSEIHIKFGRLQSEHEGVRLSLENRIKEEQDGRMALEKDLVVLTKENENLNLQLEKALQRANAVSDSLLFKIQSTSEGHAKSSEAIASGILEHLKTLTGHMMKLESSFGRLTRDSGLSSSLHQIDENLGLAIKTFKQKKRGTSEGSSKVQLLELPEVRRGCEASTAVENERVLKNAGTQTSGAWDDTTTGTAKWVVWQWRYFGVVLKSKLLLKQLRDSRLVGKAGKAGGMQELTATMERELKFAIPGQNLVSILLAVWRVCRKCPRPERKDFMKTVPLEKVLVMLPWWIRRVGEKRRLERSFLQWYSWTCNSWKRQGNQVEEFYFPPHSCFIRQGSEDSAKRSSRTRSHGSTFNSVDAGTQCKREVEGEKSLELAKVEKRQLMLLTPSSFIGSTFTARALRTLQVSLQQEFQDLQMLLAKEMEAIQNQMTSSTGQFEVDKEDRQAIQRRRMTSLWEVCNNLANSLMEAHKQLVSLDREFNQRAYNYLELAISSDQQQQQQPRSPKLRAKSPTEYRFGSKRNSFINVITAKRPSTQPSKKRSCIASQCAAILQAEFAAAANMGQTIGITK